MIVGWVLTVPGFAMLGAELLSLLGLPDLARCRFSWSNGNASCAPGRFGSVMDVVQDLTLASVLVAMSVIGLAPVVWSLVFPILRWPILRWRRRRSQRALASANMRTTRAAS